MTRFGYLFALVLTSLVLLPAAARAQQSSCADCHFANSASPALGHVGDWDRSAHSVNNVGCETCHGGNAGTFDSFAAHRGILNSANPASPVNFRNLPATCGKCHVGPFVAFQKSHHFEMLSTGDTHVPTCTTCHETAGSRLLSPKALEGQCQQCHGPKGVAPRPERAAAARTLLEAVNESRDLLNSVKPFINRISDKPRQAQLQAQYQQAQVPLIEAGQSVHEFMFDTLKERLSTARQRIEALLTQLANPR